QVVKQMRRRRLVAVKHRIVFGTKAAVDEVLAVCGWQINTAFVERLNLSGLDQGIGHFMLFEVDSVARAPAPPTPISPRTWSAASDRKSALQPSFRQAA